MMGHLLAHRACGSLCPPVCRCSQMRTLTHAGTLERTSKLFIAHECNPEHSDLIPGLVTNMNFLVPFFVLF